MASRAIKVLANLMRVRKENAEPPYVLILGAGASLTSGASSFGKVIESVVDGYSAKDPSAMSWDDKVAEFYEILDGFSESERYAIIKKHIEGQRPSAGYHALAQLAREGYLEVIFSTNYDTFVEDAFADAGLRAKDFTVLINGQDTEEGIIRALSYPQPRIKLVKLHGDLGARVFAFTPGEIFEFSEKIESVLTDYLSRDVMICGHGMRDDDINRCLRAKGGSLWYVNPSAPTASDFIGRAMQVRKGTAIEGKDGYFDNFFCALRDALVGAPPAGVAVSSAPPAETTAAPPVKPAPRPTQKTVAEADSEEVKRLKKLLEIHEKNLYRLEEKAAMYSMDIPIHLTNQIDYEQGEIDKIRKQLEKLGA
jgi:NAD-dependent SIR2 family protein deacetylase